MPKRVVSGIVTSDKMSKTRRVEINRLVKHPKYKKYIRRRTVCYAHDEANESGTGDRVEIVESAPLSKLKRWRLVRVLAKSTEVDVAALRAARKGATQAESEAIEAAQTADGDGSEAAVDSSEAAVDSSEAVEDGSEAAGDGAEDTAGE
jgi:small subunit ribosomal protein S17